MPIQRHDILGSWSLVRTYETLDGVETGLEPVGAGAYGYIIYTPDNRVSVLIAYGGRTLMSKGLYDSTDAETADSARKFTAYGGTFDIDGDIIVHHLDICLYENHRGTDYVRHATRAGDRLTLSMPSAVTERGVVQWSLEWKRHSSFA